MDKKTRTEVLRAMEVGEVQTFPIADLVRVRVQATNLGFILDRRYRTFTNRENRTINVIRIS